MSSLLLNISMVVAILAIFRSPFVGVMIYYWLGTMYPHQLVFAGAGVRWSLIVTAVTLFSVLISRGELKVQWNAITKIFLLFYLWTGVTTLFAEYDSVAFELWADFSKLALMFFLTSWLITDRVRLNAIIWAVIIGSSVYAIREGAYSLLSGGSHLLQGPRGSNFVNNNELTRLFGMTLPLIIFMIFHSAHPLVRKGMLGVMGLSIVAILASQSRGAFVGLLVAFGYFFMKSNRKSAFILVALLGAGLIAYVASDRAASSLAERYSTIDDYDSDGSFQGRVFAWNYGLDVANSNPVLGIGFGAFRGAIDHSGTWKDAHSIYFEPLAEHGYTGLALFLLLGLVGFVKAH
jgi:probable O-glycosylation ligase (exosortase A-associated)